MLIGMRDGCVVKDSTVNTTRGAGGVHNIGNLAADAVTVVVEGTTFVNVNTSETVTRTAETPTTRPARRSGSQWGPRTWAPRSSGTARSRRVATAIRCSTRAAPQAHWRSVRATRTRGTSFSGGVVDATSAPVSAAIPSSIPTVGRPAVTRTSCRCWHKKGNRSFMGMYVEYFFCGDGRKKKQRCLPLWPSCSGGKNIVPTGARCGGRSVQGGCRALLIASVCVRDGAGSR